MKRAVLVLAFTSVASAAPVPVGPGTYRPVFPASPSETTVKVEKFWLDREPVTNAQFLAFVREQPAWRRDRIKAVRADASYLTHWGAADALGDAPPNAPVVHVSWFAARAYCAARGGRLPVEKEWELAGAANETTRDASRERATQERILAWYAAPAPERMPDVGQRTNVWGVRDLHGLVWEWIEDFNAALVTADSRSSEMFCGGASAKSQDPSAYATFMRLAFRSSLQARFTTAQLGFRCAYDKEQP
jgi:formylglycine-generating enzyme required for sulfatase activity